MNNAIVKESNSMSLLEVDSDTEASLLNAYKSLPKSTDENNQSESSSIFSLRKRPKQYRPNATENATVTENSATTLVNKTALAHFNSKIFEDVIYPSPMQRSNASKIKQCLKLKRKIPDNINISCLSPIKMHSKTDIQIKKPIKTNLFICLQSKLQTYYMNNLKDDTENKPPKKKMLLDKFNVWSKRKNISKQFNMQYKGDRAKLNGQDCWECREYYKSLSFSKEELQKRKNQCSRHRHKYERPNTPEGIVFGIRSFPKHQALINKYLLYRSDFERYVVQKFQHIETMSNTVQPEEEQKKIDIFQDLLLKNENNLQAMERKLGNNASYQNE
ncbi:hypothetical protein DBV15_12305, partial [Temnothorax longispinosus]